jgi:hypothetical protein
MRGLRVNFSEEGASIDFNDSVNNFYSTVQNAVVNVGTKKETDKIFISKGTTFFEKAVAGGVNTLLEASHSSNFAADETLRFYQKTDNNTDVKLAVFRLTPTSFVQGEKLEVSVYAESSDGHIIQTLTTL